jgi:hypothetical protein
MSLGEPHSELDNCKKIFFKIEGLIKMQIYVFKKASCACVAYDVCINSNFLTKILENATFMGFFMTIVLEGLESKYSIKLDRSKWNFQMSEHVTYFEDKLVY